MERFVAAWEPALASEFRRYDRRLKAKSHGPPLPWGQAHNEPYWKEFPGWLAGRGGKAKGAISPQFLDTVQWGQTALFYAVRIQDDLLDREFAHSSLALAPLLFLSEAHHAFSSVIDANAAFWRHYRLALEATVSGIARVAEMQRDPEASAAELLDVYGSVDSIFSVGPAAICERQGLSEEIRRVSVFVGELGKVLLVLDDIEDIEEDYADGRLNYSARVLLAGSRGSWPGHPPPVKNWRLQARPGGLEEITGVLFDCLGRAGEAIAPLDLQPALDVIEATRVAVTRLRTSV